MATNRPFSKRLRSWRRARADQRLFRHLAAVHRLDPADMELLAAVADQHQLVRLAEIFVRPSLLATNPDPQRWADAQLATLRARIGTAGEPAPRGPEL